MKQNTVEINYVLQLQAKKILTLLENQERSIGFKTVKLSVVVIH